MFISSSSYTRVCAVTECRMASLTHVLVLIKLCPLISSGDMLSRSRWYDTQLDRHPPCLARISQGGLAFAHTSMFSLLGKIAKSLNNARSTWNMSVLLVYLDVSLTSMFQQIVLAIICTGEDRFCHLPLMLARI